MEKNVIAPDLTQLLNEKKEEIFLSFNCVQIGKISSVDTSTQTCEVEIQFKVLLEDGSTVSYPLLVDCPFFVLQGGGAYFDMPVKKDDYCIILFNDRDIDNWWSAANVKEPRSGRKHSLSDGLVIVGINPKTSVLTLDGTNLRIMCNNKEFHIKNATKIEMLGASESFVKGDTLYTQLNTIITALQTFSSGLNVSTLAAQAATLNTAMGTALGILSQIKSTKIKGE